MWECENVEMWKYGNMGMWECRNASPDKALAKEGVLGYFDIGILGY